MLLSVQQLHECMCYHRHREMIADFINGHMLTSWLMVCCCPHPLTADLARHGPWLVGKQFCRDHMTRNLKNLAVDRRVSCNSVVDHRSWQPVFCPLCSYRTLRRKPSSSSCCMQFYVVWWCLLIQKVIFPNAACEKPFLGLLQWTLLIAWLKTVKVIPIS